MQGTKLVARELTEKLRDKNIEETDRHVINIDIELEATICTWSSFLFPSRPSIFPFEIIKRTLFFLLDLLDRWCAWDGYGWNLTEAKAKLMLLGQTRMIYTGVINGTFAKHMCYACVSYVYSLYTVHCNILYTEAANLLPVPGLHYLN